MAAGMSVIARHAFIQTPGILFPVVQLAVRSGKVRKLSILVVFLLGVSVLSFGFAGGMDDEVAKPAANELSELKAEVANLTKKVAELEEKMNQFDWRGHLLGGVAPTPDQKAVPKTWRQREFNGQSYYVVPLAETKVK